MRLLLFLLMAMLLGGGVISALQTGRVSSEVRKHSHPIVYWISIAVGALFALVCLAGVVGILAGVLFQ
jgi:hypothetical protein